MPKAKAAATEKKEKKAKKVKDPNAPKKPVGAYMFFCKAMREGVKKEHPEWGVTDIGRELGRMWKETEEGDKKRFYEEAEKDKKRYEKENAKYKDSKEDEVADEAEEDE